MKSCELGEKLRPQREDDTEWCRCMSGSVRGPRANPAELPQSGRPVRPEATATRGRAGGSAAPGRGSLSEREGAEGGASAAAAGGSAAAGSAETGRPRAENDRMFESPSHYLHSRPPNLMYGVGLDCFL